MTILVKKSQHNVKCTAVRRSLTIMQEQFTLTQQVQYKHMMEANMCSSHMSTMQTLFLYTPCNPDQK